MNKRQKKKLITLILVVIIGIVGYIADKADRSSVTEVPDNDGTAPVEDNTVYNYVHFLDVGQGDCTLIETSDGSFGLIDASTQDACDKIISYLENEGVEELEFVVFTHPHEDHIGCGDEVLDNFKVETVYMTDKTENTAAYRNLVSSLAESKEANGTKILKPADSDVFSLDGIEFTVLSDGKNFDDLNNSSICLKMEFGKSTFIFTGDAERKVENYILASGVSIDAEVLKLGHHGSSTSNSDRFLDAVNPEIAITSCGIDNSYGHPHVEVVDAMHERNVIHKRTDLDGDIVLAFDQETIKILTAQS